MTVVTDPPATLQAHPCPTTPHRLRRLLIWSLAALIGAVGVLVPVWIGTRSGPVTGQTAEQRAVSFVTEQLRADGAPDAAVAVVRDGEIVESGTIGDGVTVDSPFRIGSMSKPFTATAVMQLVEAGRVDLDAAVTDYLPEFRTADSGHRITVRQLLNQTSGLPSWSGTVDLTKPETPLQQRVDALAEVAPISEPGTEFHYNNKNFATLGLLVQTVSGQPFAQYLRQHVLDPLGMDRTFTDGAAARDAGLIDGSSVWFGGHVPQAKADFPGALPDGDLISTARDLASFADAQVSADGLVSQAGLREMHTGVIDSEIDGARYGMGWRESAVNGHTVIAHEGDLDVYHSDLGILPDSGTGLVVLIAHNSQLWDATAAWNGGMTVLAGGPTPEIGGSYLLVNGLIAVTGVLVLVLLVAGTVGVVRRLRDRRPVNGIAIAYLLGSALVLVGFFVGVRAAVSDDVVFTPEVAFSSFAPDITSMVLVGGGWLLAAGGLLGVIGVVRRAQRSRRSGPVPATA